MKWFPLFEASRNVSSGSWTHSGELTSEIKVERIFRRFPEFITAILRLHQPSFGFTLVTTQTPMDIEPVENMFELKISGESLTEWITANCTAYARTHETYVIMEQNGEATLESALVYVALHSKKDAMLFKLRFG